MAIKFVETDPLVYEKQLIDAYEAITGRTLNPADPERLLINLITYAVTICAINIDETGRLNLLATSKGEYLDRIGELVGCSRLKAQKAKTIIRFSLSEPLSFDVIIPQGSRVGVNPEKYFYTIKEAKISSGQTYVDVEAEYFEAGASGNGYAPGQVNKMIDVIAYVASATNITMSMYGTDVEKDERYKERIRESLERFSTAGSYHAYVYHVKSVHQEIEDVSIWSPSPGVVNVTFIMKDGQLPDQSMIQAVHRSLSDEKVRPLTDLVYVQSPEVVYYSIDYTYYIEKGQEGLQAFIDSQVREKTEEFVLWTKKKLGRDILPEKLTELVMSVKGVHSIDITQPSKTALSLWQIAHPSNISIRFGGTKD